MERNISYQSGFGNQFETEALEDALPRGRNNPQKPAFGLYAEQLSGTAFTALSHENQKSWLYRILPSVKHSRFEPYNQDRIVSAPLTGLPVPPDQLRWNPLPCPDGAVDFVDGIQTMCVNGSVAAQTGCGIHLFGANQSMKNRAFLNCDGDLLILPQEGSLLFKTEFGLLQLAPGEVIVIPRGIKFQVELLNQTARGYICENYGAHFQLPYRGPIGANGLANERDFLSPVASYEDKKITYEIITKFHGNMFKTIQQHSPFDVVAWHGNYVPYKYDLSLFNTMNTVSFDHPDPSIFTVLTSPSNHSGVANIDFVIFPPRWMVAEDTFRPPYYHRNIMSEFMGLIHGRYDAKPGDDGFVPGGSSLHNCMSAHGPDAEAFEQASTETLEPTRYQDTLAFMFESCLVFCPTRFALETTLRQTDYLNCWQSLRAHFRPE